ncbi:hypothetical protein [Kamptonema sp. UHCC 0994]|uniref:hypothetical protein n=1 Tax=Kamptonema sp. UHCC 0994 TaxID=3031329 RepID=UPI0023B928C3|nr:hypothetical protein [Kamptonema sp. UHCC 0994]MDF0552169.1 hypothetical protein [Kamptonema sp. UHCC 0994]
MKRERILIATKTYPSISQKYRETVCTAGVLLDKKDEPLQWIRIYPVRYRKLVFDKQYPRWAIISANIEKNDKDSRLESYRIDDTSIEIIKEIGTKDNWEQRKSFVLPLEFRSINDIKEQGKSLGIIKPKNIIKYYCEKSDREWSPKQQAILDQLDLFEPPIELEKIPYKFGYQFIDRDDINHRYSISDWEISQLYRNCRDKSQALTVEKKEEEGIIKVKQKLGGEFLSKKDLYFIVGNLKDHRQTFMIIGIFYPPMLEYEQLKLF